MFLRMRKFRQLALAAVAVGLLAACESREFRTRLVREWSAEEVSAVKLRGINGKVKIESDPSGKISLIADIQASGRPAKEAIQRGLIDTRIDGDTLFIREKTFSKKLIEIVPLFRTGHVRISYLLKVPESTDVNVETVNGKIESEGVSGSLTLETINGPIRVRTPRGQVDAKTVNGSIRAEFTQEFRGALMRTVNGSIRLTVPSDASMDAQVDQVNGAFQTNMPVSVSSAPGHRESSGAINGGAFPLEISTVNGSVTLQRREIEEPPVPAAPPAPAAPAEPAAQKAEAAI